MDADISPICPDMDANMPFNSDSARAAGLRSASNTTPDQRKAQATHAAIARWAAHRRLLRPPATHPLLSVADSIDALEAAVADSSHPTAWAKIITNARYLADQTKTTTPNSHQV